MKSEIKCKTKVDLKARSASQFVRVCSRLKGMVWIKREDDKQVSAKDLLGVLSLNVGKGKEVIIIYDGDKKMSDVLQELDEFFE